MRTAQHLTRLRVERSVFPQNFEGRPHSNSRAQVIYPCNGVMQFLANDGVWTIPPVLACWAPAKLTHSIRTRTGFEMLSAYISNPESIDAPDGFTIISVSPLLRELLIYLEDSEVVCGHAGKRGKAASLVLDLIEARGDAVWFVPTLKDPKLKRIQQRLQKDISDHTTLSEWAEILNMSERSLNRRFYGDAGISFGKYRKLCRLAAAIELLEAGNSVSATAYNLGYENPGAFIQMFRKATGNTPSRYHKIKNRLD